MEQNNLNINPVIHESWKSVLNEEFNKSYFSELKNFLKAEKRNHKIYPPGNLIFHAFNSTPFYNVKVVIIGQDPYHGEGQAEGLSFSVPKNIKPPPSLMNIFKELKSDLNIDIPRHGHLENWATQGVLLLNAVLTVRAKTPGSHRNKGWESFTNAVISILSQKRENLVFILWGKYAQEKEILIDSQKHLILKAAHPSPYSAAAGFFGCKHFSKTNDYLRFHHISPINWELS